MHSWDIFSCDVNCCNVFNLGSFFPWSAVTALCRPSLFLTRILAVSFNAILSLLPHLFSTFIHFLLLESYSLVSNLIFNYWMWNFWMVPQQHQVKFFISVLDILSFSLDVLFILPHLVCMPLGTWTILLELIGSPAIWLLVGFKHQK